MRLDKILLFALTSFVLTGQNLAVRGDRVYTMTGTPVENGVVLITNGKIEMVGNASEVKVPSGYRLISAKVVTPGLIDAHSTVGLSGVLNQRDDQDQLESSAPIQPELRAIDAYNARDPLVAWVRSFGVTTLHTGHGPGALISGQTMMVKTTGQTAEKAVVKPAVMVAATLGNQARAEAGKSPGSRAKMIAMLRTEFIKAREYAAKPNPPSRDLRLEVLAQVVKGDLPLLVTVHRANDILAALRLGKEFGLKMVLDGAAEAPIVMEEIRASGYPVLVHPSMARPAGDADALSLLTAAKLKEAGVPVALQSGFEGYVPKTRVVLFEAALTAANGLTQEQALALITIDAARLLGIEGTAGSLAPGKDGDLALYDGDPFEYTTHCVGTVINGAVVFEGKQ